MESCREAIKKVGAAWRGKFLLPCKMLKYQVLFNVFYKILRQFVHSFHFHPLCACSCSQFPHSACHIIVFSRSHSFHPAVSFACTSSLPGLFSSFFTSHADWGAVHLPGLVLQAVCRLRQTSLCWIHLSMLSRLSSQPSGIEHC